MASSPPPRTRRSPCCCAAPSPLVVWLARGLYRATPPRFQQALAENRLLLVSPFAGSVHRAHPQPALRGQRPTVLIAHAQPGGKTEQLAGELLAGGRQVYTLDHPGNRNLLAMGAQVYT